MVAFRLHLHCPTLPTSISTRRLLLLLRLLLQLRLLLLLSSLYGFARSLWNGILQAIPQGTRWECTALYSLANKDTITTITLILLRGMRSLPYGAPIASFAELGHSLAIAASSIGNLFEPC